MTILHFSAALGLLATPALADVTLPALFSDGMVLQRGAKVAFWGWADPGEQVTVKGGWLGSWIAGTRTTAGEDGRWNLEIETPKDAGSTTVSVSAPGTSIVLKDVLLGEVWLCSGQSNMEWGIEDVHAAARESGDVTGSTLEIQRPNIRFFDVPRQVALEPQTDCEARWTPAVGDAVGECSAVAYYFACALQDELEVPIGLVTSTWGGTTAQAWMSPDVVRRFPNHARSLDAALAARRDPDAQSRAVEAFWSEIDERAWIAARFAEPGFDDDHWEEVPQPTSFEQSGLASHDGIVWYRRTVDVPARWAGSDLELRLPPIDDYDQTFWEGAQVGTTVEAGAWQRPRRYTIPAAQVRGGQATLAVRALDTNGAGGFGAGEMRLVRGEEFIDLEGPWRMRKSASAPSLPAPPIASRENQHTPSALFNGMLAPLIPYRVQGTLWYQGESNRGAADEYRALFPALIVDWRERWSEPELPFYFAQIAPYDYRGDDRANSAIAILREAQALATRLPRTGMVLTCDIGNPRDIHPKNKWEVGRRFCRFALRDVYGRLDVEPDGPTFAGYERDGDSLRVSFDHVGERLSVRGDDLANFELAGEDGQFVPARATIHEDGQSVTLRSDGVPEPLHARYLWSDAGEATLMGSHGLPAAPFRTVRPEGSRAGR